MRQGMVRQALGAMIWALTAFIGITVLLGQPSNADLYGVRSSFLTATDTTKWTDRFGMSLLYLSDGFGTEQEREHYKNILLGNGDTHIDVYVRAKTGGYHGITVDGYANQRPRLQELNASGLKPVAWLTGEGRQGDSQEPLSDTLAFIDHYIRTNDDLVSGYVVCLECDEQYTAAEVNAMVDRAKALTDKHVAVHLTPGVGGHSGNTNYYKNADFIYLQLGDHLTGDYTADTEMSVAMLKEALKLGLPVVANEYSLKSTSDQARALGDRLCAEGAAGTSNGRSVVPCGQKEQKEKWYKEYETEVIVSGIVIATLYAVSRYDLPLQLRATEESYQIGAVKKITKNQSIGLNYRDDGTVIAHYRIEF